MVECLLCFVDIFQIQCCFQDSNLLVYSLRRLLFIDKNQAHGKGSIWSIHNTVLKNVNNNDKKYTAKAYYMSIKFFLQYIPLQLQGSLIKQIKQLSIMQMRNI